MTALLVALLVAIIGPLIITWLSGRQRRKEKALDWAREDRVAARLLAAQQESIARTDEVARAQEASSTETNTKLGTIHALVNSNMTAVMRAELDATIALLAVLRELLALHEVHGEAAPAETLAAMQATEQKIVELKARLADRLKEEGS